MTAIELAVSLAVFTGGAVALNRLVAFLAGMVNDADSETRRERFLKLWAKYGDERYRPVNTTFTKNEP